MPSERPGAPKTACSSALLTSPCACGACNPHAILRRGISAVAQRCQPSCQMDEVIGYRTDWLCVCVCVCVCVLYLHTLMTHASHDTSWFTTSMPTNNIRYTLKDCHGSRCDAFDVFKHILAARARELAGKNTSKMPKNFVGPGTKSQCLNSTCSISCYNQSDSKNWREKCKHSECQSCEECPKTKVTSSSPSLVSSRPNVFQRAFQLFLFILFLFYVNYHAYY